ncbi:hypothetical protein MMC24_003077 [Lignoscripta atroalba]|nr:hypothetical protein [Lignoscripta atroalba]
MTAREKIPASNGTPVDVAIGGGNSSNVPRSGEATSNVVQRDVASWDESSEPSSDLETKDALTLSDNDIVIAVMGVTGSGKSSFISSLTNGKAAVGHSLESCTSEVGIYNYLHKGNQKVHLIDTPGFDDTHRSDTDVLKDIAFFMTTIYSKKVKLAGMLYLHRITDVRMQGSALKNVHMFKELCGEGSLSTVVLATTMWNVLGQSRLSHEAAVERENELVQNDNFWGYMAKKGSSVVRHLGDTESAQNIISILVDKKESIVLDLQRQMVDEKQTLDQTAAGRFVQQELLEARKRYERDLLDYQQSMEHALKEKDAEMIASIASQQREHEAKAARAIASERGLQISLEKLVQEKDKQYASLIENVERDKATRTQQLQAKAAEIQSFQQNLRTLQDTLDRKDATYRRDMARMREEQKTRSSEEAGRLEKMILERELYWAKQQMQLESQIARERQVRELKERELEDEEQSGGSNDFVSFLKFLFG